MNKLPFFLSAPRTRSSVLFETAKFYLEGDCGLKELGNHTELFLEFSQNAQFYDAKVGEYHTCELYPVARGRELSIHFTYPHIFSNLAERNSYKFQMLRQLKAEGVDVNIKGTLQLVASLDEMMDFYSDRKFVITKRKNMMDYVLSYVTAHYTKLFHARHNNIERYRETIAEGITVNVADVPKLSRMLDMTKKCWDVEEELIKRNIPYVITQYEDLDTQENIHKTVTDILGTEEWKQALPNNFEEHLPIKVEKDYSKLILNYDEIADDIYQLIKKAGF